MKREEVDSRQLKVEREEKEKTDRSGVEIVRTWGAAVLRPYILRGGSGNAPETKAE
jgi:hypothetical protein